MPHQPAKFEDFIRSELWKDLMTHFKTSPAELEENIRNTVKTEQALKVQAREYLEKTRKIRMVSDTELEDAERLLFGNQVCAADGTYAIASLSTTGIKGQIGIVTTSYVNKRTDYIAYFYEPLIDIEGQEFLEILNARKKMRDDSDALSSNHIRAIMLYMERKKAMERGEKWKMINGDIFPFELRTGQGRLRGLKACLELEMEIFNNPHVIGITANSKDYVLNTLALGLSAGEYVDIKSYKDELDRFLDPATRAAHFNDADMRMFRNFASDYGDNMRVGLYKAKKRSRSSPNSILRYNICRICSR